jgi:endonuclease/exonuclease/phosphatase family metal-dependent hydrolase
VDKSKLMLETINFMGEVFIFADLVAVFREDYDEYHERDSRETRESQISDLYSYAAQEVHNAIAAGYLVAICGDFNAKIGVASEFVTECPELIARFPKLARARRMRSKKTNRSGALLLDMAISAGPLVCTTGRGHGDDGQPTCKGKTRIEHILLHPDLFAIPHSTQVLSDHKTESDHCPLPFNFGIAGA